MKTYDDYESNKKIRRKKFLFRDYEFFNLLYIKIITSKKFSVNILQRALKVDIWGKVSQNF